MVDAGSKRIGVIVVAYNAVSTLAHVLDRVPSPFVPHISVVLLHGDGQYAPEHLPKMVAPLLAGECDAVLGSRMMEQGAARRGGMPLYKFAGNRVLTTVQNAVVGTNLSEWHSGYRAYSVAA